MILVIEASDNKPVVFTREVDTNTASEYFDVLGEFASEYENATITKMYMEK